MAIISIHPKNPQERLIRQASQLIDNGDVIAYPSDTSYALAASIFNKKAVEKLYKIKKPGKTQLFSCVCYDYSKLTEYAVISNNSFRIMKHLLPGPYTFILKGKSNLPKITLTKRKTIGVRMPGNPITQMLYNSCASPFLSCGITLEDEVLNEPHEIHYRLRHLIELVIDGGEVPYAPSSIISLVDETPAILREGSGDLSFLKEEE
jgi:tRNA threonylcarbamoyl adenosine modification protein (Sua5/YciO/YrdC/YwlC family)